MDPKAYIEGIYQLYATHSHAENAEQMRQYMQGKFEYFGIKTPERRALDRSFIQKHGLPTIEQLEEVVDLANQRKEREIHHFGAEVVRKMIPRLDPGVLPLIKKMITTNSWWDTVDMIATHHVGKLSLKYPEVNHTMDLWIKDENMWLNRTALLYQLLHKEKTDTQRLFSYCEICSGSEEFFIQKAIGWALRQYSRIDANAVSRFVEDTPLAPLSIREGLKLIRKKQ